MVVIKIGGSHYVGNNGRILEKDVVERGVAAYTGRARERAPFNCPTGAARH